MAEKIDSIINLVRAYIEILKQNNIHVADVFLFGSFAKQSADEWSDIDIAVLSSDFSGDRFMDRRRIVPLRRQVDRRIEPMPFRPEDFKDNDPLVVAIKTHGLKIA